MRTVKTFDADSGFRLMEAIMNAKDRLEQAKGRPVFWLYWTYTNLYYTQDSIRIVDSHKRTDLVERLENFTGQGGEFSLMIDGHIVQGAGGDRDFLLALVKAI